MNKQLISIIIPFYNADKYIGRMLDSLLKQDLATDRYEIIIVDDGSTDESVELNAYIKKCNNIKYVRKENEGPGAARNTGLEKAVGEYVFFCDSDDYVAEDVLGKLYNIAHGRNLDMLFFNVPRIKVAYSEENPKRNFDKVDEYDTGMECFGRPFEKFISMGPCQFISKRVFLLKYNLCFPPDMIMNEDACFFIDAMLVSEKTAKVDVDVYFYIQNSGSLRFYGKEKQAKKWTENCLKNLEWLKNQKAYIVLMEGCRYLPTAQFLKVKKKLVNMDSYPKPFGKNKLKKAIKLNPFVILVRNIVFGFRRKMV